MDEDSILLTFDVVSLYDNIPTELEIEPVKFWSAIYPNLLHDRIPQEFALQGLKQSCPGCNEFYIGETGNTLFARVRVHKQLINTTEYRQIALTEHWGVCGQKQFQIFPFYKLASGDRWRQYLIADEKKKAF